MRRFAKQLEMALSRRRHHSHTAAITSARLGEHFLGRCLHARTHLISSVLLFVVIHHLDCIVGAYFNMQKCLNIFIFQIDNLHVMFVELNNLRSHRRSLPIVNLSVVNVHSTHTTTNDSFGMDFFLGQSQNRFLCEIVKPYGYFDGESRFDVCVFL